MIDNSKMSKPEYGETPGEMSLVCGTLQRASDIIRVADQTPDESVKKPLFDGARVMIQNCLDALDGRRTDGLVIDQEEDD